MARLHRESSTPLYIQLKDTLTAEIQAGRYQPQQRLPSERELCERYQVSRMTVRQAISGLIRDGWVYARVGKGTFVSVPKFSQELRSLTGFNQDVRQHDGRPSSEVLEAKIIPANPELAETLKVFPNAEVVLLSRLRLADGVPLAMETAYLPHGLFPGLLQHDFTTQSLYAVIENQYHMPLVRAEQTIEAALAGSIEQEQLGMNTPAAVLRIERRTFTHQDLIVEYVESTYRGDRYKFRTHLQAI